MEYIEQNSHQNDLRIPTKFTLLNQELFWEGAFNNEALDRDALRGYTHQITRKSVRISISSQLIATRKIENTYQSHPTNGFRIRSRLIYKISASLHFFPQKPALVTYKLIANIHSYYIKGTQKIDTYRGYGADNTRNGSRLEPGANTLCNHYANDSKKLWQHKKK